MFASRVISLLTVAALVAATFAAPAPVVEKRAACTNPLQRKAWQSLTDAEKKAYLDAELCLMWQKPSAGFPAAVSRFDDLVKAHQLQSDLVHQDAYFLPFHRLHMHAHELLLRTECGYKGAQPYWDETSDAGKFTSSEIFDAALGFGGDGTGTGNCIATGPFANYTLHTGPGYENTAHCIQRELSDRSSLASGQSYIDTCMAMGSFAQAWPCIELMPHSGGHGGVGGEMVNPISSPGDPLFYMHHTWLDRVWWLWQQEGLPARLKDFSGYTTPRKPATGWVNATLKDTLNMFGIIPNATVADVMDPLGELMCFEYIDP
ncbi:hypothetical protein EDC01DRAFT_714096 [Geopyxis carbonaria]|nr:hypothetical protein EDC01DRAFT_714096 [Geopyxis carbonaria]